jgi:hypothetical protein
MRGTIALRKETLARVVGRSQVEWFPAGVYLCLSIA